MIWKEIPGYDGQYFVSDTGVIRSCAYGKTRFLKQRLSTKGYPQVNLSLEGKMKTYRVHRLVAMCFDIPGNGCEINHKNENKADNRVENLEWCDRRYNVCYGSRTKKQKETVSKPVIQLTQDGMIITIYPSEIQAGRVLRVSSSSISACCSGKRKTAGGFQWRWQND